MATLLSVRPALQVVDATVRRLATSPAGHQIPDWPKDANRVPPNSTSKAQQASRVVQAASRRVERASRSPAPPKPKEPRSASAIRSSKIRIPPLPPKTDPRLDSTSTSRVVLSQHLPSFSSAHLPRSTLQTMILGPLYASLDHFNGSLAEGSPDVCRPPASIAWTFSHAAGHVDDPANQTLVALTHASDLTRHLATGADGLDIYADLARAASLADEGKVILFVLNATSSRSIRRGQPPDAELRQKMRIAEMRSRKRLYVNHRADESLATLQERIVRATHARVSRSAARETASL